MPTLLPHQCAPLFAFVHVWVIMYLRTAPQYRQSTRKIGLRALVTRTCDVCLIRTTMASTNCSSNTHVCTRRGDKLNKAQGGIQNHELTLVNYTWLSMQRGIFCDRNRSTAFSVTLTIVLLCRMKVWKPNQRSFMHSSNATITKASSSKVA